MGPLLRIIMLFDIQHLPRNFFTFSYLSDVISFVQTVSPYVAARWFLNVNPAAWSQTESWLSQEQGRLSRLWLEVRGNKEMLFTLALGPFDPTDTAAAAAAQDNQVSVLFSKIKKNWGKVHEVVRNTDRQHLKLF